ncbi:DMT family transporter [Pseudorhodobacter wandonensis]|jgi:drug/metabolite transporter (DMT)-like permease|uniref:DMT family transporter n=1 Tax=Pseudorhodobacter wandonensis TaxID=1120568 RepID=UPI00067DAA6D|nr:DMT family transporter [Pseudorhodobacter wandonensis]
MAISNNSRGILYMVVAMATFTLNDTFMKLATETVPLSQAIAVRGTLTVLALLLLARVMGVKGQALSVTDRKLLGWRTFAEVGGTITFLLALRQMPLANISAILQSLPLAVTLAAAVLLKEPVGWRRMTAILVGFCGVMMIVRPGTEGFNIWSILALISVGFIVLRDLSTRQVGAHIPSVVIALYSAVAVTIMGYAGLALESWRILSVTETLMVASAAGILILGYMFSVMAMRVGDVAIIAPFRYTSLIVAIFLGWFVFDTLPGLWTVVGAVVVVATGLYTYLRENQLHRRIVASKSSLTGTATADR